jgi:Tol biopolymer transport system component
MVYRFGDFHRRIPPPTLKCMRSHSILIVSGSRLGSYDIVSAIGAGGMGEVYRARDTKLNRDVALKVLPEAFTCDPDRLARFKREAQVLASLNHPNIAAIYGFEESNTSADSGQAAVQALVLELVEGPTLADRIAPGPLLIIEALRIAKQIAEALETAHEQGIVHRDLKPANIKVRRDGTVKVLDFGLAKIAAAEGGRPDVSRSPTITSGATRHGVILGTVAYMSPEQARGKPIDRRTDIWSFGCVLYEMLTGRTAFTGESVSDTIVAVLDREPDWSGLPNTTPPAVRRLLQRCLEKDARRRLHDVADVRIEIDDAMTAPVSGGLVAAEHGRSVTDSASARVFRRDRLWPAATAAMAIAVVVLATLALRRPAATLRPRSLSIVPSIGTTFTPKDVSGMPHFAMSPDGNRLAFVAAAPGARPQLWVKQLDSGATQPLPGTDDARGPFWAPDSRSLAFYARGKLKKVSAGGAVPQDLADALGDGGAWNASGIILFSSLGANTLVRISQEGGAVAPATQLDAARGELAHRWPQFLPDGRRFIFHVLSASPEHTGVFVGSLDTGEKTQILRSSVNAVYAGSGHLLFDQAGTLMVQPFDNSVGALSGQASAFGDRVLAAPGPGYLALSIGADGTLAYWNGQAATTELLWFDRSGRPLGKVETAKQYQSPALSPGARSLLITEHMTPGRNDLWNIDLSSGVPSRLTFPTGEFSFARFGIWSPDGKTLLYSSFDEEGRHMYQMAANGTSQEEVSLGPALFPEDWSRDGRWIVYSTFGERTAVDIAAFNAADKKPRSIVEEPSNQLQARLSPDSRWLAYSSDESGEWEVYVRSFPDVGRKWLVSRAGGSQPLWRGDSKELFYVAADGRVVAVPIVGTDTFEVGVSQPLFATRIPPVLAPWRTNYAVTSDGQRFLVNSITPEVAPAPITIAVNWQEKWKK